MKNKLLLIIVCVITILIVFSLNTKAHNKIHTVISMTKEDLQTDTASYKYMTLYNFLVKEHYPFSMLGTLQEFTEKIKIESHARALYEGLRKDGYTVAVLGTEEQFVKKYCKKMHNK